MSSSLETSNTYYKKLEIMLNIPRDMMIEKILHDKEQDLQAESHEWLIEEIIYHYKNGCPSLDELTDKELAEKCIEIFDRDNDWGDEI